MFIELFFAAALDMSMPEFQPQEDISGNVIVSEVDDVSGEFIAEEVPLNEIPIEKTSDLPLLGLSQEEDPTEELPVLRSNGDRSSNLIFLENTKLDDTRVTTGSNGVSTLRANTGTYTYYVQIMPGNTYNITADGNVYTSLSLSTPTTVTLYSESTITPTTPTYLICGQTVTMYVSYENNSSSGGDVSGGDVPSINVDLSNIENKIDKLIVIKRSILFVLIVNFCYPLIISIFNNIGGGRDV